MEKRFLLLVRMDPPTKNEAEWSEWYNKRHIADRMNIQGFIHCRRFEITSGMPDKFVLPSPKYLTLYELADERVLNSKAYQKLLEEETSKPKDSFEAITKTLANFSGGLYGQIFPEDTAYEIPKEAKFLLGVAHANIPPKVDEEYNAWYNTEHIPSYLQIPGFLNARRFHVTKDGLSVFPNKSGPDYVAVYDLANDKVFETEDFKVRSATPWSARVRGWTWPLRRMNNLFRCIYIAKK